MWSAIEPKDRFTWFLEVAPALIGLTVIVATHRSYPLTPLVSTLILGHCIILMVGGHYTYAEVPLFDHLGSFFGSSRNNYDKLGHFAQGFVPALIAREIVIREQLITSRGWRAFFIACFALALSAFYELIEWWVGVASGEDGAAFLGTQGYVWDTQSDMGWALVGALCALLLLGAIHDRQIDRLSTADRSGRNNRSG